MKQEVRRRSTKLLVQTSKGHTMKMAAALLVFTAMLITPRILVAQGNVQPDCTNALANPDSLWPPNHKYAKVSVTGVTDLDGDPITIVVTGIFQDEALDALGDGRTCPDGAGVGTDTALVRAERGKLRRVRRNGRVYHVSFVASDGQGGECAGTVPVCVPANRRQGHVCVDEGPLVDSTGPCNGGGATPTPATATATRTVTPAPTATSTPGPLPCEVTAPQCDGFCPPGLACIAEPAGVCLCLPPTATPTPAVTPTPALTATPTPTRTPTPTPTSTVVATCPTEVTILGTAGSLGVLDAGWTGQSHDSQVIADGLLTMAVTGCAGTAPTCGVCDYAGPIENANAGAGEIDNERCSCDSRVPCTSNADCPGSCECVFHFGSYLPLSAGGVSTCVKNNFQGPVTGTFNEDTGASAGNALLLSTVWTGPTADDPCPKCLGDGTANDGIKGGTCSGGQDNGAACDIMGTHPNAIFGNTSLDCRPMIGGEVAFLDIDLSNTTGTRTRTLSAANPNCTAPGFTGQKCHCDTCATAVAEVCATNADCPGGAACGGRRCIGGSNLGAPCTTATQCPGGSCGRPGKATAPNECDGGVGDCAFDIGNEWACQTGPFELFCGPSAIHKACATNADCTVPGDTCRGKFRNCYNNGNMGESVTATGVADVPVNHEADPTLAALFCIGPTTAPAVNAVAGLPGLGRLELPGHATDNGTGP